MGDRLTDAQLRAAAAARPGYATYPEYAPGGPERLAPYWRANGPLPRVPEHCYPPDGVELPVALPPAADAVQYLPTWIPVRPWWRPRWHWLVITRDHFGLGYTWTEAGARRRTRRHARRAVTREYTRIECPAEPGAETAAGACTDPADGADTACDSPAGDAAPAPAPPPPPAGGAGVTPSTCGRQS